MTDLLLNSDGDLDIQNGVTLVPAADEEARQRTQQAIAINLGEWFVNINDGLPYIRNPDEDFATNLRFFLGDKFPDTPQFIADTMTSYIENLSFIDSVESSFTFNNQTRVFTYSFKGILVGGEEINFPSIFTTNL